MQINRTNYEEYFLLYADGELTTSESNAVLEFVKNNQDLAIEFQMIQDAVLPLEELAFEDKSFLYKDIKFETELQQNLLLKIDNELPSKDVEALNEILLTNTNAQKELTLLTKVKLDSDEKIIFNHKHLLYKKEREKVVPFFNFRWAAAAAILLFATIFFTSIKLYKNSTGKIEQEIANANTSRYNTTAAKTSIGENNIENKTSTKNIVQESTASQTLPIKNTNENINNANLIVNSKKNNSSFVTKNNTERITTESIKNNITAQNNFIATEEVIIPNTIIEPEVITVLPEANIAKNIISTQNNTNETYNELENTYVQRATIAEEKTEDKILYINESTIKKSKIGGFFKRFKTSVAKATKLKPGNSIQIAGFEISGN